MNLFVLYIYEFFISQKQAFQISRIKAKIVKFSSRENSLLMYFVINFVTLLFLTILKKTGKIEVGR